MVIIPHASASTKGTDANRINFPRVIFITSYLPQHPITTCISKLLYPLFFHPEVKLFLQAHYRPRINHRARLFFRRLSIRSGFMITLSLFSAKIHGNMASNIYQRLCIQIIWFYFQPNLNSFDSMLLLTNLNIYVTMALNQA